MDEILEIARTSGYCCFRGCGSGVWCEIFRKPAGVLARSLFFLHPLKVFNAAGDAGFLTTDDEDLAHRLRLLRNNGSMSETLLEWGIVSRLDVLQAVILTH